VKYIGLSNIIVITTEIMPPRGDYPAGRKTYWTGTVSEDV
jgi:hypothetical protein